LELSLCESFEGYWRPFLYSFWDKGQPATAALLEIKLIVLRSGNRSFCCAQAGVDLNNVEVPLAGEEDCPLRIDQANSFGIAGRLSVADVAYAIPLRMVAQERVVIADYSIVSRWDPQTIELPHLVDHRGYYKFGRLPCYRTSDVLNDRFENGFAMKRGAVLEGVMLAYGCVPIPQEIAEPIIQFMLRDTLGRESHAYIRLHIPDQYHREHRLDLERIAATRPVARKLREGSLQSEGDTQSNSVWTAPPEILMPGAILPKTHEVE
jgi:hypothetical protein